MHTHAAEGHRGGKIKRVMKMKPTGNLCCLFFFCSVGSVPSGAATANHVPPPDPPPLPLPTFCILLSHTCLTSCRPSTRPGGKDDIFISQMGVVFFFPLAKKTFASLTNASTHHNNNNYNYDNKINGNKGSLSVSLGIKPRSTKQDTSSEKTGQLNSGCAALPPQMSRQRLRECVQQSHRGPK